MKFPPQLRRFFYVILQTARRLARAGDRQSVEDEVSASGSFVGEIVYRRLRYFIGQIGIIYCMSAVRRLWAVCASFGIVLAFAFPSALCVDTGGWYCSLRLPEFALDSRYYTFVWAAAYLADVVAYSSLFCEGADGARLYLPVAQGVFNVFWCYCFFVLHSVIAAVVVSGIIAVWSATCAILNFRKNAAAFAAFTLKTVWLFYLFAVIVAVMR